jgi:hypothetical protein
MPNPIHIVANKATNSQQAPRPSDSRLHFSKPDLHEAADGHSDLSTLLHQIDRDPFVGYVTETDHSYIVRLRHSQQIIVPKGHGRRELFPPLTQSAGDRTIGMIGWMVFGLLPAGVGTLILCPFVLRDAFNVLRVSSVTRERRLAVVSAIAALVLGAIGEVFVLLLVLHLIG